MSKNSLWARASEMAERTPPERNRYVDFLRALSISAVVLGHWIMAAPHLASEQPQLAHLLDVVPWSRWLTWGFQVMPIFFFVGGYSNGTSWDGARARHQTYTAWLEGRLRRLLGPVIPLLCLWILLAIIGGLIGIPDAMIRTGSQVALVPVWFLAIYLLIVMLVPISRAAWHRFGIASFLLPALLAAANDVVFFTTELQALGWLNYLFVWSAVHQLGYAWQHGTFTGLGRRVFLLGFGAAALIALTQLGPYPTSLVGVPSQALSNTTPPKLPLLALGLAQIGLFLTVETQARRWLAHPRVWTSTVLVNGLIMTIFLWHSTVMMLLIGAGFWLAPQVFSIHPGSVAWWAWRPIWVGLFALATLPFLTVFMRVEASISNRPPQDNSLLRLIVGAVMLCVGLALLAAGGVTGDGPLGLDVVAVFLPILGSSIAGFGPHQLLFPNSSNSASERES